MSSCCQMACVEFLFKVHHLELLVLIIRLRMAPVADVHLEQVSKQMAFVHLPSLAQMATKLIQ